MLLIPAIDLKDGQCVRLKQGLMDQATVFSDAPEEMGRHWVDEGARRLHIVDLDGAFAGSPKNLKVIDEILQKVGADIPVQLGGGIRDVGTIENYIKLGLSYVILGTAAVKQPELVTTACREFPGRIIVGLDAKDGQVAIDGWAKVTEHNVIELGKRFADDGIDSIIYTDIGRDGMMSGVNIEATVRLAQGTGLPIIASGGLTNLDDIDALVKVADQGIIGVITGRAIYEGTLNFQEGQQRADALTRHA